MRLRHHRSIRVSILLISFSLHATVQALRGNSGSPCASTCEEPTSNTTVSDIVCRDTDYNSTEAGTTFVDCVECQLESTYVDRENGASDVQWGLYNLRYAFSTCLYGFPEEKHSLSTPCQVSCEDLRPAIKFELVNSSYLTSYTYCDVSTFQDDTITKCAECYAITEREKYLANYIETLRQACYSRVPGGFPFIISPERIFTGALLPASTESAAVTGAPESDTDEKPKNLVLIIVLPIIAFLLILTCSGVGCYMLVRRRRRKAKRTSHSTYLHERWNDTSITSPGLRRSWGEETAISPGLSPYFSPYQSPTFASPQPHGLGSFNPDSPQDIKVPPESYHSSPVSPPHSPIPLPTHPGGGNEKKEGIGIPLTLPPDGIPPWSKKRQQAKEG